MQSEDNLFWYVVKTNSRAEKRVVERISSIGLKAYLPLIESIKQWSDRKKKIQTPLIPSTLFVNCRSSELAKLYDIQGFHSILHFLKKPAIVRDYEIENLKILLKESDALEPFDNVTLMPGENGQPPQISTEQLFQDQNTLRIAHEGSVYLLRLTRENKLILTK